MTRSLRVQAYAQWWTASGDDVKPSLGTWRECHPTFQLTKHWDYRSTHQSVDDLTAIGSAALVAIATAGSTNSIRTISANLLTYGEQLSGVVILERRYGSRRLRDDEDDDERQVCWSICRSHTHCCDVKSLHCKMCDENASLPLIQFFLI